MYLRRQPFRLLVFVVRSFVVVAFAVSTSVVPCPVFVVTLAFAVVSSAVGVAFVASMIVIVRASVSIMLVMCLAVRAFMFSMLAVFPIMVVNVFSMIAVMLMGDFDLDRVIAAGIDDAHSRNCGQDRSAGKQ